VKTLLLVHAHPDDESIATGGVMLRAKRDGHRVVLVTCTRGEEGQILNLPEGEALRDRLGQIRTEELRRAGEVLGIDRQVFLGFRDSGMAGTVSNQHPESFHQAPLAAAAEQLAVILREEQPTVVVTYTADGTYGHPDHIKAHQTTLAALQLMAAEGYRPDRLFLHAIPRSFITEMGRQAQLMGVEIPADMTPNGVPDSEVTTVVDVREFTARKLEAFRAHVSQNDPNSPFQGLADQIRESEMVESAFGIESFVLASHQGATPSRDDLFGGLED